MTLLVGPFVLRAPGVSYASVRHPFSETTALMAVLPLPNSPTSWLPESFTGGNARVLAVLEALSLLTQGSIFFLFLLSVSKQGAYNILCTSHICTVQSRSLLTQCFFLIYQGFPVQTRASAATWLPLSST